MSLLLLSAADVKAALPRREALLAAVTTGLVAQAQGVAVAAPTVSFHPDPDTSGMISAIRGALPGQGVAAVKLVGTYPDNAASGLATNPGLMVLFNVATGRPRALLEASHLTTLRTAAVSALGIRALARGDARIVGCIGTRGIAVETLRLALPDLQVDEVRLHGRDAAACERAAHALSEEFGVAVRATDSWRDCLEGADIMIDGASLPGHRDLFPGDVVGPGSLIVAFGAWSAFGPNLPDRIDRLVMDRWGDGDGGALGPHVAAGRIGCHSVDAFIGDVLSGRAAGRKDPAERILFWHRGVAACDIALAQAVIAEAQCRGLGLAAPFET